MRGTSARSTRRPSTVAIIAILAVILVALAIAWTLFYAYGTQQTVKFKVTDKITKRDSSNKDQYLIFTDHGVYKDTDSLLNLKFNSSDVYAKLQRGHTYTCKVNGFRLPFFSSYKNILHCNG